MEEILVKDLESKESYDPPRYCACGCGQEIYKAKWHNYGRIPKYISGHHSTNKKISSSEEVKKRLDKLIEDNKNRLCACGCGCPIIIKLYHLYDGVPRFIAGHNGRIFSNESKAKMSKTRSGKKLSEYHKQRIREGHANEETKRKMSLSHKGKPKSEEWKRKISKSHMGIKPSPETLQKMSENMKGKLVGDKNPNWKGGIARLPYPYEFSNALKNEIRKRDNYICQICGKVLTKDAHVHHIDYNKNNNEKINLITLCRKHHSMTNYNREIWFWHLAEIQIRRYKWELDVSGGML